MDEARENEALGSRLREGQLRLPFDQYQRYRMIADVVELLREDSGSVRLLDVSDGEGVILNFLPKDEITSLDQRGTEGLADFVNGDATSLPFDAEAFDYVISTDVYAHIVPESRERYLSELRRASRKGVLLAAPFDSEVVRGAESVANEFHRSIHLIENVRLKEHAEKGLPSIVATRQFFEGQGDVVHVLPNGYVPHWLAMICLTFYSSKGEVDMQGIMDRVNVFYNEYLYESDNTEPCYRHLLIALRSPVDLDVNAPLFSRRAPGHASESQALFGALSTILPLATEMKRLDTNRAQKEIELEREQAKLRGELARREAQVEDLSRRLAERVSAENSYMVRLQQDQDDLRCQKEDLQDQIEGITSSRAWRFLTVLHKFRLQVAKNFGSG
jgi:hypothetical protein